jgi:hypothetical protein
LPNALALVLLVRVDVAVVESRHRVTALDGLLQRPDVLLLAAPRLGGPVVLDAGVIGVHPRGRDGNLLVIDQGMVAAEVHTDEHRGRALAAVRDDEQHVGRLRPARGDRHGQLFQRRLASERLPVLVKHLDVQLAGLGRAAISRLLAVHVVLKERFQLGAALRLPLFLRGDARAVEHHQRVGQAWVGRQLVGRREVGGVDHGRAEREKKGQRESHGVVSGV